MIFIHRDIIEIAMILRKMILYINFASPLCHFGTCERKSPSLASIYTRFIAKKCFVKDKREVVGVEGKAFRPQVGHVGRISSNSTVLRKFRSRFEYQAKFGH